MEFWSRVIIFLGKDMHALVLGGLMAAFLLGAGLWTRAARWLLSLGAGVALVLAGKLAFGFYGWSLPGLEFYVISGHAMLTAAVYPVGLSVAGAMVSPRLARWGLVAGLALALVVSVVLVLGLYHTVTETLAGAVVGLAVTAFNVRPGVQPFVSLRDRRDRGLLTVLVCVAALLPIYRALGPLKDAMWEAGARSLGVKTQYLRDIQLDVATGRPVVVILECDTS